MLALFNALFQNLHPVEWGSELRTDGCVTSQTILADVLGRTCCVVRFHNLQLRMLFQEVATLHQRHRVRIHLCDVLPRILWQTHDAM